VPDEVAPQRSLDSLGLDLPDVERDEDVPEPVDGALGLPMMEFFAFWL
jgi:hypothetical protein